MTAYLLHIEYTTGTTATLTFPSAFDRALVMIGIAARALTMTMEDREATS